MSTRTITVPANARVIIEPSTVTTEAKAPVSIPVRKASGKTPLYKVRPTSGRYAGKVCGVFWEGPCKERAGVKRIGIRMLTKKSGYRLMTGKSRHWPADFMDADSVPSVS